MLGFQNSVVLVSEWLINGNVWVLVWLGHIHCRSIPTLRAWSGISWTGIASNFHGKLWFWRGAQVALPHTNVTVYAGQRSVAEKGRAVRIRKQEMIFFHENALGAATQECATRALRERNPWRHLVSGRHRFVISVCELRALIWPTRHVSVSLVGRKPTGGARIVA